jgi:hypothetical protein
LPCLREPQAAANFRKKRNPTKISETIKLAIYNFFAENADTAFHYLSTIISGIETKLSQDKGKQCGCAFWTSGENKARSDCLTGFRVA